MSAVEHRSFVSGFCVSALGGLMQSFGDLVTLTETEARKAEKLTSACPTCAAAKNAVAVKQGYTCEHGHGPFTQASLAKMREVGKKQFVLVDGGAIAVAKESELPANALSLGVYRRADVAPLLKPSGTSYVFREDGRGTLYPVLLHMLARRPDLVFVGQANIKDGEKLCLVDLGLNGQILITQIEWPGDLRVFEAPTVPAIKPSVLEMAEKLLDEEVADFTAVTFVKGTRTKLSEVLAAAANGVAHGPTLISVAPTDTLDDLEELLRKSLEKVAS